MRVEENASISVNAPQVVENLPTARARGRIDVS